MIPVIKEKGVVLTTEIGSLSQFSVELLVDSFVFMGWGFNVVVSFSHPVTKTEVTRSRSGPSDQFCLTARSERLKEEVNQTLRRIRQ